MTEEQKRTTDEAWREVGQQFEALGRSLSHAFRTTWESEETRRHVGQIRDGLETMVQQVDEAVKEASASPRGQKVRGEAEKAAESLRAAGEQTWQDTRPHLLSALTQIDAELQKMIERLSEEERPPSESPTGEGVQEEETQ